MPIPISKPAKLHATSMLLGHRKTKLRFITVVGNCRQERCTCSSGIFALHSERLVGKGRWKNSEQLLFRVGGASHRPAGTDVS
jgi:hypothetical protein